LGLNVSPDMTLLGRHLLIRRQIALLASVAAWLGCSAPSYWVEPRDSEPGHTGGSSGSPSSNGGRGASSATVSPTGGIPGDHGTRAAGTSAFDNAGGTNESAGSGPLSGVGDEPYRDTGGSVATGGTTGTGGSVATGGTFANGGSAATGGTTSTGGAMPVAGTLGIGGSNSTGGASATGGTPPTGGAPATGGALNCAAGSVFCDNFESGTAQWTPLQGTWATATDGSSVYTCALGTNEARSQAGSLSWTDYTVSARIKLIQLTTGRRIYLAARFTDADNWYGAGFYAGTPGVQVRKKLTGTSTTLNSATFTWIANQWYLVAFKVSGSTLTMFIDGAQVVTATDTSFATGSIALLADQSQISVDNVVVTVP